MPTSTDTAAGAEPLIEPVVTGQADMTIGTLPAQVRADGSKAGGHGFVVRLARAGIEQATGWAPEQPLSGQRCLTRVAFDAALPLASGFGVETALSIDLGRKGFRIIEVPIDVRHRATGTDWRGQLHRGRQFWHVRRALAARSAVPPSGSWSGRVSTEETGLAESGQVEPFRRLRIATAGAPSGCTWLRRL